MVYDLLPTRQLSQVDLRGLAIPNLLHRYLLLSRPDRSRQTKAEHGHKKQAARARILTRICEIGVFMAHLSEGVLGRSGEARGPNFEKKTIFEIGEIPNLLHPPIYFIRGLLLTTGG